MLYKSQIAMSKVRFAEVGAIEKYPACLTMELSGARSPRHRAMALYQHYLTSISSQRRFARPFLQWLGQLSLSVNQ
jgi:hypothetical protein